MLSDRGREDGKSARFRGFHALLRSNFSERVAELVDAKGLSREAYASCGFESHLNHQMFFFTIGSLNGQSDGV